MSTKSTPKTATLVIVGICAAAAVICAAGIFLTKEASPLPSSSSAPSAPETREFISAGPESARPESEETTPEPEPSPYPAGALTDWNLILLGPQEGNSIDGELDFERAEFDGQQVDARAAPAYEAMRQAAGEAGVTLYLRSGYRSIATQEQNVAAALQRRLDQGLSEQEAQAQVSQYYTEPGHSEHHSGLAFDIITPEYHRDIYELDDRFAGTDAYAWLREHCAEFGFILRYPEEKEDVTMITFEPWHYRYVGPEHAAYIMEHSLCLEEYIDLLREAGR